MSESSATFIKNESILNILARHDRWLHNENDGQRACFTNMNLQRFDFHSINLAGVDFTGANLSRANFEFANLTGCNFSRCDAAYATFDNADLSGIMATGSKFVSSTFANCQLNDAVLRDADFSKCIMERADLFQADCTGMTAKNINFRDANLERANFFGANLFGAYFIGAKLNNVVICNTNIQKATVNDSFLQISLSFGTLGFHVEEKKLYYSFPYLSNFNGSDIGKFLAEFLDYYPEENPENERIIKEIKWAIECFMQAVK